MCWLCRDDHIVVQRRERSLICIELVAFLSPSYIGGSSYSRLRHLVRRYWVDGSCHSRQVCDVI